MKYLLPLLALLLLAGCTNPPTTEAEFKQQQAKEHHKKMFRGFDIMCINNVKYLYGYRKLSAYIDPITLKPENCGE